MNGQVLTIHWWHTDRKFLRGDFSDRYDTPCSIQESSLAEEEALWLGRGNQRMHLTREMARTLGNLLINFANTGDMRRES
jgi:hypothetical protein